MRPFSALALAATLVFVPLAACQSGKADMTGQSTEGFYAPNYDTLWDVTRRELNRAKFTADLENSDKANHVMVSRWNTHLAPFAMKGWREQATVTLRPVPGREGYWTVEANVIRQNNKQGKAPMEPSMADWTPGDRDTEREARLVYSIEAFFLGGDVSERFRTRYGMPAGRTPVVPVEETPEKPVSHDPLNRR